MMKEKFENTLYSNVAQLYHKNRNFMNEELRKRGITDLGFSHVRIVILLYINGQFSMKEITEKIAKDKSTVSILVNKLEKKGYVKKKSCEKDKRVIYLELGDKAEEILDIIFEVSKIFQKKVEETLDEGERETFIKIMSKLIRNW